jgi:outer membrane lipoprotein-sorting protein
MRLLLFVLLLTVSTSLATPTPQQQQIQKDPTAVTVLIQMNAVTGWIRAARPMDINATGNLTRYSGDQKITTSVRFKTRTAGQFRMELQNAGKTQTKIVNGPAAADLLDTGQVRRLPPHIALSTRPVMFPFLLALGDFDQSDVSVRYLGTEDVAGQLAHKVEIRLEPSGDDAAADTIRRSSPLIVWISTTNYLPLQVDYIRLADTNRRAELHFVRRFADYRRVDGILIPYMQQEFVEGELRYSLQLSDVQFNVGLRDSDFVVPAQQGGR